MRAPKARTLLPGLLVASMFFRSSSPEAEPRRLQLSASNCDVSEISFGGYAVYEAEKQPNGGYLDPLSREEKIAVNYLCRRATTRISCVSENESPMFGEVELDLDTQLSAQTHGTEIFTARTTLLFLRGANYFFTMQRIGRSKDGSIAVRRKECYGTVR